MNLRPPLALACGFLLAAWTTAAAAPKHGFSPEDYYALREAAGPQISPDGKSVVFTLVTHSRAANADLSSIWLMPIDGSQAAKQLTASAISATRPAWSPDGKTVAFISTLKPPGEGAGAAQVQLLAVEGGGIRPLTSLRNGVREFHWSPDGSKLICGSSSGPSDEAGPPPIRSDRSDTRHYSHILYKRDGRGYLDDRRDHLWVVDAASAKATKITEGDWDDRQPEWSPDGRHVAFVSDRSGHALDTSQTADIWVVSADGGDPVRVSSRPDARAAPRGAHSPHWSPDGAKIIFLADVEDGGPTAIWMASGAGAGTAVPVFKDDYLFMGYDNDVIWRGDGVYYLANHHGTQQLFRADLRTGKAVKLTGGDRFLADLAIDKSGREIVFASNDFQQPSELYAADGNGGHERRLTAFNQQVLERLDLPALSRVDRIKGPDGLPIDGFLAKPVGWRAGETYPMVLLIHGGPSNMFGFGWTQYMQALTAQGYAVFYTNPRGSSGYGWDFIKADDLEWGGKGAADVMAGVDAVLAQNPWIDGSRLGVSGASYGGFMTNWLISHSDRFAAAVPIASISNLVSDEGTRDEAYGHARVFGGDIFENYDLYWGYSPLKYARAVKTPTLILHGAADDRVPTEQPEQWFRALQRFNVPSELVLFPREHHTSYATGEPKHVVEAMHWMAYWFDRYLNRNADAVAPDRLASEVR